MPVSQMMLIAAGAGSGGGGGGGGVTFNSSQKTASVSLSGSDLIASSSSGTNYSSVLGTPGKTSGKWVFGIDFGTGSTQCAAGIATALPGSEGTYQTGSGTWAIYKDGYELFNASESTQGGWYGSSHRYVDVYLDATNKLLWYYDGSTYHKADAGWTPITPNGGRSLTGTTFYPFVILRSDSSPVTLVPGGNFTLGSGYSAWA